MRDKVKALYFDMLDDTSPQVTFKVQMDLMKHDIGQEIKSFGSCDRVDYIKKAEKQFDLQDFLPNKLIAPKKEYHEDIAVKNMVVVEGEKVDEGLKTSLSMSSFDDAIVE